MEKEITCFALASKVLVVCVKNKYDWTAYIDAVKGIDHEQEKYEVARVGDKLNKEIAFMLFPNQDKDKWRA